MSHVTWEFLVQWDLKVYICSKISFCSRHSVDSAESRKCANYNRLSPEDNACNNVMLVMINHPSLFHSIAGRAAAVKLQWVSKLLLLLTAQLRTQILASQTAEQTENWLQRKLQEMIYANLPSRGRNIAIKFAMCINRSGELELMFMFIVSVCIIWYSMETKPRAITWALFCIYTNAIVLICPF